MTAQPPPTPQPTPAPPPAEPPAEPTPVPTAEPDWPVEVEGIPGSWPLTLRCGPVILRPPRRRDARAWLRERRAGFAEIAHLEAYGPTEVPTPPTAGDFHAHRRWARTAARRGEGLFFLIFYDPAHPLATNTSHDGATPAAGDCQFAGQMLVYPILSGGQSQASLGYWTAPTMRRRQVASRAVHAVGHYLRTYLEIERVEILTQPFNEPSIGVVRAVGAKYEGMRQRAYFVDGAWRDHQVWTLLR